MEEPLALQEPTKTKLKTGRSDIIDRNGILLATSLLVPSLYADPKEIIDADDATVQLRTVLKKLNPLTIKNKLQSKKRFVWLKRHLSPVQQYQVNALGIPGLHFQREEKRYYPQGRLSAHIVGFSGTDAVGLSGIEKQFDDLLRDGSSPISLSVDVRIQHILREEISRQIFAFNGIGGAGVFMNVNTGEILAMVSLPDFDPDAPSKYSDQSLFNRASHGVYEMGSTFKIFNTALALDIGSVTLHGGYDATKPIRISRFTINDYHPKARWLSVPEIFMYSSNIGSAKMAFDFGSKAQRHFMRKLGFLSAVPIEIPERGVPLFPSHWQRINTATIAFGHGIAVSPLHLISGVSSIINGGIRWPPTILKRESDVPVIGEQIITERTSMHMRRLFRLVVNNGTGRKASAIGYVVGGKTGTAEKLNPKGGYIKKDRLSSFVAAFPIHNPEYAVLVMIDEPKGNATSQGYATGGWVAAPAVRRTIIRSAPLLGIHPKDEESPLIRHLLDIDLFQEKGSKHLASF